MKRTLPIASQLAALASTLPPTSDNVMTIPSDTFMTVLLFCWPVHEGTLYLRKTRVGAARQIEDEVTVSKTSVTLPMSATVPVTMKYDPIRRCFVPTWRRRAQHAGDGYRTQPHVPGGAVVSRGSPGCWR